MPLVLTLAIDPRPCGLPARQRTTVYWLRHVAERGRSLHMSWSGSDETCEPHWGITPRHLPLAKPIESAFRVLFLNPSLCEYAATSSCAQLDAMRGCMTDCRHYCGSAWTENLGLWVHEQDQYPEAIQRSRRYLPKCSRSPDACAAPCQLTASQFEVQTCRGAGCGPKLSRGRTPSEAAAEEAASALVRYRDHAVNVSFADKPPPRYPRQRQC